LLAFIVRIYHDARSYECQIHLSGCSVRNKNMIMMGVGKDLEGTDSGLLKSTIFSIFLKECTYTANVRM